MTDLKGCWAETAASLRKAGVDLARRPCYLLLAPGEGGIGKELRDALPRVPNRPMDCYDANDPLQVYADSRGITLTWTGADAAGLQALGMLLRSARKGRPAVNGLALLLPLSAICLDDASARTWGERCYQLTSAWRQAVRVHAALFVVATMSPSPAGEAEPWTERVYFPLDLWHYPGRPCGVVDPATAPGVIEKRIRSLFHESFTTRAFRQAPDAPADLEPVPSALEAPRKWFRWLSDHQGAADRLAFVLRMTVIGAYGVRITLPDPTAPLPAHDFREAGGPLLLGGCHLATDAVEALRAVQEDLDASRHAQFWAKEAVSEDRTHHRLARVGAAILTACLLGGLLGLLLLVLHQR